MKWAYSIQQKFKAALLLAIICAIIIITNLLGRHHMDVLSNSLSSVYEDRLVASNYIYLISHHLYQKKLKFDTYNEFTHDDLSSAISSHNDSIRTLLSFYEKTWLTEEEAACLEMFKTNARTLQNLELQLLTSVAKDVQPTSTYHAFNKYFALGMANLRQLSSIQVQEGKALKDQSQRIAYSSYLLTNFEMVILLCIAVILQIIVIASKPIVSRKWQQNNLN